MSKREPQLITDWNLVNKNFFYPGLGGVLTGLVLMIGGSIHEGHIGVFFAGGLVCLLLSLGWFVGGWVEGTIYICPQCKSRMTESGASASCHCGYRYSIPTSYNADGTWNDGY